MQDLSLDALPADVVIHWDEVQAIDRDNTTTLTEVGVKRGREFYSFRTGTPGAAARGISLSGGFWAPGDYIPTARFWGATAADVLELHVCGVQED